MALDWTQLIHEHRDWEAYNFPDVTLLQDLMGVQEEIGELTHHYLKMSQGIRGSSAEHIAEMQDAVGDTAIYMLGVMHHLGVEPLSDSPERRGGFSPRDPDKCILLLGCQAGYLIGSCLGLHEGRAYGVDRLIHDLERFCHLMAWDFERIVIGTWVKVKRRDWQKDPFKGVGGTSDEGHPRLDP